MVNYLIEVEIFDGSAREGEACLTREALEFYWPFIADMPWELTRTTVEPWNGWQEPLEPRRFDGETDLLTFAGQKRVLLLSEVRADRFLTYRETVLITTLTSSRLTIHLPWKTAVPNVTPPPRTNDFDVIALFREWIENRLPALSGGSSVFVKCASLRVPDFLFAKFRPDFDHSWLAENSVFEALNLQSTPEAPAPDYVRQLLTHPGFPGTARRERGPYACFQWLDSKLPDRELRRTLGDRQVWIARSGLVPRHPEFNVLGDERVGRSVVPSSTNPYFDAALNRVFLRPSLEPKVTEQEWQRARSTMRDLRQVHQGRGVRLDLVVSSRLECFDNYPRLMEVHADNIDYIDGNDLYTPFPWGMWRNDTWGEMRLSYAFSECESTSSVWFNRSANYLIQILMSAVICFKRKGDRFLPHWLLHGGSHLSVTTLDEERDEVILNEGGGFNDVSGITLRLSDGEVTDYNESPGVEVIRLRWRG